MSNLPADEVDGTELPAGFLNLILAALLGNRTMVDPGTRTASDNLHDFGIPGARIKNVHAGGRISADGQNIMRAEPVAQSLTGGVEFTLDWQSPLVNVGTAISPSGVENFLLNDQGIYLVNATIAVDLSTSISVKIEQERPIGVFVVDSWTQITRNIVGLDTRGQITAVVIALAADAIQVKVLAVSTANLVPGFSDLTIIRLY